MNSVALKILTDELGVSPEHAQQTDRRQHDARTGRNRCGRRFEVLHRRGFRPLGFRQDQIGQDVEDQADGKLDQERKNHRGSSSVEAARHPHRILQGNIRLSAKVYNISV